MAKHVIELNGQKYDATTGKPLASAAAPTKTPAPTAAKHLDGFTRRPSAPRTAGTKTVHVGKTQKSQTLMRKVVKKPSTPAKVHTKAAGPSVPHLAPTQTPKIAISKPGRTIRATAISQSGLISKFGKQPATIKSEVVPVKPAPEAHQAPKQVVASKQAQPPKPSHKAQAQTEHKAAPAKNRFQEAIENAASHEAPKLRKARMHHRVAKRLHVSPRLVTFTGATLAVLAIGGVFAYQNMPEIAMKVASTRAGLNASLPAYQPAGFALAGPIKYDSGEVTLNYKSHSDERAFNVVQKNSAWNSETLLESFVETSSKPYQTFQANGRTIYIYDGNKATWVDGGVWYNIDGEANLNSDQLLKIAESL